MSTAESIGGTLFVLLWNGMNLALQLAVIAVGVRIGLGWHERAKMKRERTNRSESQHD